MKEGVHANQTVGADCDYRDYGDNSLSRFCPRLRKDQADSVSEQHKANGFSRHEYAQDHEDYDDKLLGAYIYQRILMPRGIYHVANSLQCFWSDIVSSSHLRRSSSCVSLL